MFPIGQFPLPPVTVRMGVEYLLMALAVNVARLILLRDKLPFPVDSTPTEMLVSLLLGVAVAVYFITQIYKGKHWARILKAVFLVLDILNLAAGFTGIFASGASQAVLLLAQIGLEGYGLYLVFAPASEKWFTRKEK